MGGTERKRWRLAETEIRESMEMAFEVYGGQLKTVPSFNYLEKILRRGTIIGWRWRETWGRHGRARDDCIRS